MNLDNIGLSHNESPEASDSEILESAPQKYPGFTDFRIETYIGSGVTDEPKFHLNPGEDFVTDENGQRVDFFGGNLPDHVEHKVLVGKKTSGA